MRPTYNDIFELMALHANDALPLFADRWARFPTGTTAREVVARLRKEAIFWTGRNNDTAEKLRRAADEITARNT